MLKATALSLTVAAIGFVAIAPTAQAQSNRYGFTCKQVNSTNYVTVLEPRPDLLSGDVQAYNVAIPSYQSGENSTPVVVWSQNLDSAYPGGSYQAASRCLSVSARLTNLGLAMRVQDYAGMQAIAEMARPGLVNSAGVVAAGPINVRSVLFTLTPENLPQNSTIQFQNALRGVGGPDLPANLMPPIQQ